jgi:hypothetical protein
LPSERPSDSHRYAEALQIVRLPNWSVGQAPPAYCDACAHLINAWGATAGVIFQAGNEPELELSPGHYGEGFPVYAAALRARWPTIKLANPPLQAEHTKLLSAATCEAADFIAVHSYWQVNHPEDISNRNLGNCYDYVMDYGKPVIVTEVNAVPASGIPSDTNVDWDERNRQVAKWASLASGDGVHACCLFIADASADWAGFDVGPESAAAIRAGFESENGDGEDVPVEPPEIPEEVPVADEVYGEDLIAKFETQIGHPKSGDYDMRNGYNHPWAFFCEAGVESTGRNCGLAVVPRSSAITAGEWAREAGVLQQGEPEHGGVVYFGDAFFRDYGHTGIWNADRQQTLSTLVDGTGVGYRNWGPNTIGFQGWYRLPGIAAPRRTDEAPMPSWIVQPDNPYQVGKPYEVGIGGGFARLYTSVDIGAEPLVVFGYAKDREEQAMVRNASGTEQQRTVQRFQRGVMIWQPENDFPWDIVLALETDTVTPLP